MGWIAGFKDTEGNMMGFHQAPPNQQRRKTREEKKQESKSDSALQRRPHLVFVAGGICVTRSTPRQGG